MMIAVKLMGGLGNQMFQYAVGRQLALMHKVDLVLDISALEGRTPGTFRRYELKHLSIDATLLDPNDIFMTQYRSIGGFRCFLANIKSKFGLPLNPPNQVKEKGFAFDPKIPMSSDNCYLQGYFQSEKYFYQIRDVLIQDFKVVNPLKGKNKEISDKIVSTESVSIHIRRGDYVNDQKTAQFHGTCSLDFYRTALDYICSKLENPHFYFFSDDIEWVRKNIVVNHPAIYVDNNADCGYEDMRLMSMCRHHVVANSSFSWWAAWLSNYPDKIVLAPKNWFRTEDLDTRDLVPSSWVVLDN